MTPDYSLAIVTHPTTEVVSIAALRAQCNLTDTSQDGMLAGYIVSARQEVERMTGLVLSTTTLDMSFDAFPSDSEFELARAPVQSITSITYVDAAGATQTMDPSQYVADVNRLRPRVRLAYGASWPSARAQPNAVTVRFVAGYAANAPSQIEPLRQAILMLAAFWFQNREAVNVGNIVNELPHAVADLVSRFRTVWL